MCLASTSWASTNRGGFFAARDSLLNFVDEIAHDGLYFVKILYIEKGYR